MADPHSRAARNLWTPHAPLARRFAGPVQRLIHSEVASASAVLAAALVALAWANSPWAGAYDRLWATPVAVRLGPLELAADLRRWINEGLMSLFFFVVGLETKREFRTGELAGGRRAALPLAAAAGGMAAPALLFLLLNPQSPAARGWAIPTATDIAFALALLGLLGRHVPPQVRVFVLALAVADDIGAIVIIAAFYSGDVSPAALGAAAALLALVALLRYGGVQATAVHGPLAALLWIALFRSGLHAALTGVLLAAVTPTRPALPLRALPRRAARLAADIARSVRAHDDDRAQADLGTLETLTVLAESPLVRLERRIEPWSSFVVVPLFALANAGVALSPAALRGAGASSVTLGIALGLALGKPAGIAGSAALAAALRIGTRPRGVTWPRIAGAGMACGIGFTVSLFIADLAYPDPTLLTQAKAGILLGSAASAAAGYLYLRFSPTRR